jgi:hypothetical protein
MSFPAKTSRKIVVNNHRYSWVASGNDGFIALTICDRVEKGQKLLAQLAYHYQRGDGVWLSLSVTPSVVEQVINYGMAQGWKPGCNGKDLNLYDVTNKVEINA